jgi:hypothetical protein
VSMFAFSRHDGIYRSDVFNPSYKPGPDLPHSGRVRARS